MCAFDTLTHQKNLKTSMTTCPSELNDSLTRKMPLIHQHLKNITSTLPHFKVMEEAVDSILSLAEKFKNFRKVIVLGTGGSSLGGQTLVSLSQNPSPHIIFLDNIDATHFTLSLREIDFKTTGIIVISKSGNTPETITQMGTIKALWPEFDWQKQSLIITENKPNALREIAHLWKIPLEDHPTEIGGRFSVFTLVGLLPAAIAGLDIKSFRQGGLDVVRNLESLKPEECPYIIGALQHVGFMSYGISQSVIVAYSNTLYVLGGWYAQLWGESLGKVNSQGERVGSTPVRALGAVDQHSQLQLYIDGPRDKFFTFLTLEEQGSSAAVDWSEFSHPTLKSLSGHTMGQLMLAEQKATIDAMRAQGCYLRQMSIQSLSMYNLGALMAHFILETLGTAYVLEINPFDQPAVEQGKKLAMEYLKENH